VGYVLTGVNILMHGWATYVRHAIAKKVFSILNSVAWPAGDSHVTRAAPLDMGVRRRPEVGHGEKAEGLGPALAQMTWEPAGCLLSSRKWRRSPRVGGTFRCWTAVTPYR